MPEYHKCNIHVLNKRGERTISFEQLVRKDEIMISKSPHSYLFDKTLENLRLKTQEIFDAGEIENYNTEIIGEPNTALIIMLASIGRDRKPLIPLVFKDYLIEDFGFYALAE
jgi:hypothetical protein